MSKGGSILNSHGSNLQWKEVIHGSLLQSGGSRRTQFHLVAVRGNTSLLQQVLSWNGKWWSMSHYKIDRSIYCLRVPWLHKKGKKGEYHFHHYCHHCCHHCHHFHTLVRYLIQFSSRYQIIEILLSNHVWVYVVAMVPLYPSLKLKNRSLQYRLNIICSIYNRSVKMAVMNYLLFLFVHFVCCCSTSFIIDNEYIFMIYNIEWPRGRWSWQIMVWIMGMSIQKTLFNFFVGRPYHLY